MIFGGGAFPASPFLGGGAPHGRVLAGEASIVGPEHVIALGLGDVGQIWLPGVGIEDGCTALVKPVDLLLAEEEDATENQFRDAIGVRLRIGEGECRSP
jgi:hypothetical protein